MRSVNFPRLHSRAGSEAADIPAQPTTSVSALHPFDLDQTIWMPGAYRISKRAIRLPSVLEIVGCGRSHWYALLSKKSAVHDSTAPQPFKLGPSPHSPSVWWEHEVLAWLEARAQRRFH